jgi:hypothetical protein
LFGQALTHPVDVPVHVRPNTLDVVHVCGAAQYTVLSDLHRDTGDLIGKVSKSIDHRVDRRLELTDLTIGFDPDLLREVSGCDGSGDV